MTSVDSDFKFLCGRPHGAGPSAPVHMRPPEPDPPLCGHHKWMAPYQISQYAPGEQFSVVGRKLRQNLQSGPRVLRG